LPAVDGAEVRRPIRSFVLRQGRMTASQQRAFLRHWPNYGIDLTEGTWLSSLACFGNDHPLLLEIGFGNGENLAALAAARPECNFIGIEMHRPGVGHLLIQAAQLGLDNLRLLRQDAVEVLGRAIPPGSLDSILLFFPDPWHKTRHHKRRMVQPEFVERCADALRPGGQLHLATDWEDYAWQMMRVLSACPRLENSAGAGQYAPRPGFRPLTRFEQRGQRLGHGVWDLLFRRC
jgi:tRNA (guanine-N7-)-methyltransferase